MKDDLNSNKQEAVSDEAKKDKLEPNAEVKTDEQPVTAADDAKAEDNEQPQSILTKVVPPVIGYATFFGALVIAIGIGLLVCLG